MPARSVCPVALSLSEAGPGRFGGQVSVMDINDTIPCPEVCTRGSLVSTLAQSRQHTLPFYSKQCTAVVCTSGWFCGPVDAREACFGSCVRPSWYEQKAVRTRARPRIAHTG